MRVSSVVYARSHPYISSLSRGVLIVSAARRRAARARTCPARAAPLLRTCRLPRGVLVGPRVRAARLRHGRPVNFRGAFGIALLSPAPARLFYRAAFVARRRGVNARRASASILAPRAHTRASAAAFESRGKSLRRNRKSRLDKSSLFLDIYFATGARGRAGFLTSDRFI